MIAKERREKPALQIEPSSSTVEGDAIILRYALLNPTQRTMHAYAKVRRIEFDPTSGLLKLSLDDNHIEPGSPLDLHLKVPPFLPVAGGDSTTLELHVPRQTRRLLKVGPGERPRVLIEDLEDFQRIELRVAFSDTPFYYKPHGESMGTQLRAWVKGRVQISHDAAAIGWRGKPVPKADDRLPV
jgi:hypothetical protein